MENYPYSLTLNPKPIFLNYTESCRKLEHGIRTMSAGIPEMQPFQHFRGVRVWGYRV